MIPRRVLLTADAVGGVWTHALALAAGLAGQGGVETVLAVLGPPPDEAERVRALQVPGLRLVLTGLGLEWQDRKGPLGPEARAALLALERACGPDLVHVNGGYREAAAGFRVPVLLGAHSCVRSWWRAVHGTDPSPAAGWAAYEAGVREGLAAADLLVAPTRAFLAALAAAWDPPLPCPATVVPNGLDLDLALPERGGTKEPVILAAGRLWDEAKGIRDLAAVAPRLAWPVEVAGEGGGEGAGEGGLRALGRLAPQELHARMARAAIFVSPARYEPFGLAVLEAAHAGCALVLARIPSLVELWDGAARFVPPGEPAALHEALEGLIADAAERERLQAAARARAGAYGRARMAEAHLALYAGLLAARSRPRAGGRAA